MLNQMYKVQHSISAAAITTVSGGWLNEGCLIMFARRFSVESEKQERHYNESPLNSVGLGVAGILVKFIPTYLDSSVGFYTLPLFNVFLWFWEGKIRRTGPTLI